MGCFCSRFCGCAGYFAIIACGDQRKNKEGRPSSRRCTADRMPFNHTDCQSKIKCIAVLRRPQPCSDRVAVLSSQASTMPSSADGAIAPGTMRRCVSRRSQLMSQRRNAGSYQHMYGMYACVGWWGEDLRDFGEGCVLIVRDLECDVEVLHDSRRRAPILRSPDHRAALQICVCARVLRQR